MTEAEAIKVIGIVAAFYLGRFTKESIAIWAKQMIPYSYEDGIEGANDHGSHADHPSMKELKACIELARKRRCDRLAQEMMLKAIPAPGNTTPDPEHEAKTVAAMKAAIAEFASRFSMPDEPTKTRPPMPELTPEEIEFRKRLLEEQAERLLREEGLSK